MHDRNAILSTSRCLSVEAEHTMPRATQSTSIPIVQNAEQVRTNLATFNRQAQPNERIRRLIRHTQYWVYEPISRLFGPSKFVGFVDMTMQEYLKRVEAHHGPDGFDGHRSRKAIESAVGSEYVHDPALFHQLRSWVRELLGEDLLAKVSPEKRVFVSLPEQPMLNQDIQREEARRNTMWEAYQNLNPSERTTKALADIGIRPMRTGQGIFRDLDVTRDLAPPDGVTLALLDLGTVYSDTYDEENAIYYYPKTDRGERDRSEVIASQNAHRLGLPVFFVVAGARPSLREVRRGWIEAWDDDASTFLISFQAGQSAQPEDEGQFQLRAKDSRRVRTGKIRMRMGQARFRFNVIKRYGKGCAVCDVAVPELLEGAHLCAVHEGGTNDARNGLVLCRNHHYAFDQEMFAFESQTTKINIRKGFTAKDLGILRSDLTHLAKHPHIKALEWRWKRFHQGTD